jgi:hypothetical protein
MENCIQPVEDSWLCALYGILEVALESHVWSYAPSHACYSEQNGLQGQVLDPPNRNLSLSSFYLRNIVLETILTHREPATLATSQASVVPMS